MKVIRDLFSSKKFIPMFFSVVGVVVAMIFKQIDIQTGTYAILGLVGAYIGAQGMADIGKEKAKICDEKHKK